MAMEKEGGSNQQFLILGASLLAIATILSIIGHSLGVNTLTGNYQRNYQIDRYDGSFGRTSDATIQYQRDMDGIFNNPESGKLTGKIIYRTSDQLGSGVYVISVGAGARQIFLVPASKNSQLKVGDMVEITLNNNKIRDIRRMG